MEGKEEFGFAFGEKHEEDLRRIQKLCLLDDDFMSKVFEDEACAAFLLGILLERDDLSVQEVHVQKDIRNLQGRSVRLDILAVDDTGSVVNVEIQRSDRGAGAKRARYYSSLLDANVTTPGDRYEDFAETYVIFITERDVLKGGLPIYHIDRTVREMRHAAFGDGAHILYVNAEIKDETALGRLMHDFSCTDAGKMEYTVLAERVRYFKEDTKGVRTMSGVLEEMRRETAMEAAQEASKKTQKEERYKFVNVLWEMGIHDLNEIAAKVRLSVAEVADALGRRTA